MAVIVTVSTQANYNLTGAVLVMNDTITNAGVYQLYIGVGNGVNDAADTAGTWELYIDAGGQISEPFPQYLPASSATRKLFFSRQFPSRGGGEAIKVYLKSPNGADTTVNVDCRLYEITGALPGYAPATQYGLPLTGADGDTLETLSDQIDGVALASVVGTLADAAAAGDPTTADTLMKYIKQLVNVLVGSDGVGTFPAAAAPANAVSLAEVLRSIHADVTADEGHSTKVDYHRGEIG